MDALCNRVSVRFCAETHRRAADVLRDELYRAIHIEKRPFDEIAEESGVPKRTVRSYMDATEAREPSVSNALSIACVLGERSVNALLSVIGYGGAKPLDEPEDEKADAVIHQALPAVADLVVLAHDGIQRHERKPARRLADTIVSAVLPYSSVGAAA